MGKFYLYVLLAETLILPVRQFRNWIRGKYFKRRRLFKAFVTSYLMNKYCVFNIPKNKLLDVKEKELG